MAENTLNPREWIDDSTVVPGVYKAVETEEVGPGCDDCSGCDFYALWLEGGCDMIIANNEGRPCHKDHRPDGINVWWKEVV